MYALPAFACEASITLIAPAGRSFGVTLVHVLPPSRVTCTTPVLAPVQITPAEIGETASVWMTPPEAGSPRALPVGGSVGWDGGATGTVRSGLIVRHVVPRSPDAISRWP